MINKKQILSKSKTRSIIKSLIPLKIKRLIKDYFGISGLLDSLEKLYKRIDKLEEIVYGGDNYERSRKRWCESEPNPNLTWGRKISGDNFIFKVSSYTSFTKEKSILEIGPGYGRLIKSCLDHKISFKNYIGLDISLKNVQFLQEEFKAPNIHFICGDVEEVEFSGKFDILLSSLTFKHLYPTFEKALVNIMNYMNSGGMIFFDLIEGHESIFEDDGITYIHHYSRLEVEKLLKKINLRLINFDEVQHAPDFSRLLVIARMP